MRHSASTPVRVRPRAPRRVSVVAAGLAVAAAASMVIASPALAAKPTGGTTSGGSCAVNPNPVAALADYTLTASGLGANTFVNVLLSDSGSTTSWNLQASSTGTLSLTTFSYWTGTTKVTIQKSVKHNWATLATCSFSVV
jgi:hypothetical protein